MKKPNPYAKEIAAFKREKLRSIEKAKRAAALAGRKRGPKSQGRAPVKSCWLDARAHALVYLDAKAHGRRLTEHLSRLALRGLCVENAEAIARLDAAAAAMLATIPLPPAPPPEPGPPAPEDPPQ